MKGSVVYALARDGAGQLYAGGDFGDAGGDPAGDYIAVWDGSEWHPLGGPDSPLDGYVYALAVNDAGQLVVGGEFFTAGGDPDANYIALWDGVKLEFVRRARQRSRRQGQRPRHRRRRPSLRRRRL